MRRASGHRQAALSQVARQLVAVDRAVLHQGEQAEVERAPQDQAASPQPYVPTTVRARLDADDLVLAPMVVLEMEHLHEIGRLTDPAAVVVASLAAGAGVSIAKAPFAACVDAALGLTWTRDPFDRLIVGTAIAERAVLATADRVVRGHHADSFWG